MREIISSGEWRVDDLCVHADSDEVRADPCITRLIVTSLLLHNAKATDEQLIYKDAQC